MRRLVDFYRLRYTVNICSFRMVQKKGKIKVQVVPQKQNRSIAAKYKYLCIVRTVRSYNILGL